MNLIQNTTFLQTLMGNHDQSNLINTIYCGTSIHIVFNFPFKFSKLRSFVVECHFEICHPPDFASSGLFKQKKKVVGQNANRTKCQPDIMPTKGWHFVQPFFSGWHFVRPNFLVGILSGPSQHVLAFCPIDPSRCEMSFSILFIQYPTHLGQLGPPMGNYGQI